MTGKRFLIFPDFSSFPWPERTLQYTDTLYTTVNKHHWKDEDDDDADNYDGDSEEDNDDNNLFIVNCAVSPQGFSQI